MYDVIIIGAGTAGLMVARQLSCKFLVLESKKQIGYPLRCGEGIRESVFLKFFKHINYPFVKNKVTEHVFLVNHVKRSMQENYLQVDKPKLEQWLAKPLKDHIKCNQKVVSIKKKKDFIEMHTYKKVYAAKLAIIATGSQFLLQTKLGLCSKKKERALGYGGLYRNFGLEKNKFYYLFDDNYAGYFWVFPKTKDIANIGFGALNTNKNVRACFQDLLKKYAPQATPIQNYAGLIDCSGPIKKTVTDRILVCGGAAGFVHAATGEGITYALISGKIAGIIAQNAIGKKDCSVHYLKRYEKAWKHEIGKELQNSLDVNLLMRTAYNYNVSERLFNEPTEQEIKLMITRSALPRRARLALQLIKLFGLAEQNLEKRNI